MIPRMISHPIEPAIFTFFTALASTIAVGGVSSINFALDYQVVPVSLIGIAFSLAVFPTLSAAYADRDQRRVPRRSSTRNVVTIGALTTLAAIALFIGSGILVEVLLGGGEFGPEDVARTSAIVAAFAISVPFDALAYPLSRGLYATHDTIRQVVASFAGFGVGARRLDSARAEPRAAGDPARIRARDGGQGRLLAGVPASRGYGRSVGHRSAAIG